jgi:glucose/arabinose dehydrogenase
MPHLATALLILLMLAVPSGAFAQAGVSYQVPPDNPFVGQAGAAPEVYALGLRNPYRFSFDRQSGDVLIGDVGGSLREEIDWVTAAGARGANFGWPCREGTVAGPGDDECPAPGAIEPLFDYPTSSPDAVTGGFVVRDPALTGLFGRYLYADHYTGEIFSLKLALGDPDNTTTGETIPTLASFGEDASGRLYAVNRIDGTLRRLVAGPTSGTLSKEVLAGPFSLPIAIGTYPGDANRLFVGEQGGKVRLVVDDAVRSMPYLDVAPFGLDPAGERGLLSVVAAPDYPSSGKIYVYYTDADGDIRIEEFIRSSANPEIADPSTRRTVLVIEHSSAANHNGGQMHFGADGCMWVTTGDGGGSTGHANNPQNPSTLLGKVLRIDPEAPGPGRPECVASQGLPGPGAGDSDTTAPSVFASARRRQRVLRQGGAFVNVRCSEHCSLNAGGTLLIRRRRLLLRRVPAALTGGSRARLLVRVRPRGRRVLRRALRRGGRPRVQLRLHASDAAGNRSPLVLRSVRVRR